MRKEKGGQQTRKRNHEGGSRFALLDLVAVVREHTHGASEWPKQQQQQR